jgi:cell division protein FtsB
MGNAAAAVRARRRGGIRWDRLGRVALLATLVVIMLLYVSPASRWLQQSSTAGRQQDELSRLTQENRELKSRVRDLRSPGALEREARRYGMVKPGERAYAITDFSRR